MMKKIIPGALAACLILSTGALYASTEKPKAGATKAAHEEPTATPAPAKQVSPWFIGFGTGADLAGSNWDTDFQVGGGGMELIGYKLDKNFSLQAAGEQWVFTGGGHSETDVRFLLEVKATLDGEGWQPYVLAGPGIVTRGASPSGDSTANADALAGLGIQIDLGGSSHLFAEARYNLTLTQDTTLADVPLVAGIWTDMP
jgi:hypothetical protein